MSKLPTYSMSMVRSYPQLIRTYDATSTALFEGGLSPVLSDLVNSYPEIGEEICKLLDREIREAVEYNRQIIVSKFHRIV
jgi:hypothetical protein